MYLVAASFHVGEEYFSIVFITKAQSRRPVSVSILPCLL